MSRRGRGGRGRHNQQHRNTNNGGQSHHSGNAGNQGQQPQGQRAEQRQHHQQQAAKSAHDALAHQGSHSAAAGKVSFPSALQPRRSIHRPAKEMMVAPRAGTKTYKAVFYDTLNQARADLDQLRSLAASCDQLNIIVRAEASMDDADLNAVGKLFCGAAWALIHERRKQEGWYEAAQE